MMQIVDCTDRLHLSNSDFLNHILLGPEFVQRHLLSLREVSNWPTFQGNSSSKDHIFPRWGGLYHYRVSVMCGFRMDNSYSQPAYSFGNRPGSTRLVSISLRDREVCSTLHVFDCRPHYVHKHDVVNTQSCCSVGVPRLMLCCYLQSTVVYEE